MTFGEATEAVISRATVLGNNDQGDWSREAVTSYFEGMNHFSATENPCVDSCYGIQVFVNFAVQVTCSSGFPKRIQKNVMNSSWTAEIASPKL